MIEKDNKENFARMKSNPALLSAAKEWLHLVTPYRYAYNFHWLGVRAIQFPNDTWALQEIIWKTRPDFIVETGVAHGGSLIYSASMLALLDLCDSKSDANNTHNLRPKRKVFGVEVDLRDYNRKTIESHPLSEWIEVIDGDSTDAAVLKYLSSAISGANVLVLLDSNHTHNHVYKELCLYSELCRVGNYIVVFDTVIENMQPSHIGNRPWGKGNSPATGIEEFLKTRDDFEIDMEISHQLQISVAEGGFLIRTPGKNSI